jgi:hypothetical protein
VAEEPKATPEHVPEVVLEELLKAFSEKEADAIDFDDPAIDHMLGLSDSADSTAPTLTQHSDGLSRPSPPVTPGSKAEPDRKAPEDKPAAAARVPSQEVQPPRPSSPKGTLIVIGDDDLPDALYLDEESSSRLRDVHAGDGDESGGRSTIVISDLDESGGIETLPARSSGSMDPRVRARRIAVRRAKGRARFVVVRCAHRRRARCRVHRPATAVRDRRRLAW